MTLQGPHQVANASTTTILLSLRAAWNSALLHDNTQLACNQGLSAANVEEGKGGGGRVNIP